MDKKKLLAFLIEGRTKTYAENNNSVKPAFSGGRQYEFKSGDLLYRDFFNIGNGIFIGFETVCQKNKPVWSNCYYGNFKAMTEIKIDTILRQAMIENKDKIRPWHNVFWKKDGYSYSCNADSGGSFEEISGSEEITKNGKKVYFLYYAGGYIG